MWVNKIATTLFQYIYFCKPLVQMHEIWCTSALLYPECSHLSYSFKFQNVAAPPIKNLVASGRTSFIEI